MQISAAVVHEVGGPFTLAEVELGEPAADEVLVKIAGVGLCHTDLAVKDGHLPFPLPGVLGHEGPRKIHPLPTGSPPPGEIPLRQVDYHHAACRNQ